LDELREEKMLIQRILEGKKKVQDIRTKDLIIRICGSTATVVSMGDKDIFTAAIEELGKDGFEIVASNMNSSSYAILRKIETAPRAK
jgi:hypothetical protein